MAPTICMSKWGKAAHVEIIRRHYKGEGTGCPKKEEGRLKLTSGASQKKHTGMAV